MYYLFFPNTLTASWSKSNCPFPAVRQYVILPISPVQHAEPQQVPLAPYKSGGRGPPSQMQCKQLARGTAGVDSGFWGVFQQECFVSIPYFRLLPEMALQFRKCSLRDGFDICIVSAFDSQLAGLFLLFTGVYLGAFGCLSDSCQTNFL